MSLFYFQSTDGELQWNTLSDDSWELYVSCPVGIVWMLPSGQIFWETFLV